MPIGLAVFVEAHASNVVGDKRVERLARLLLRMPYKRLAMLVSTKAPAAQTSYLQKKGVKARLWRVACGREASGRIRML